MQFLWIIPVAIIGLIAAYVLFLWIAALCVDKNREYTEISPFYRSLVAGIGRWIMALCRVHPHVEGEELLPKGRFLLVGNHRSNFDPFVTWVPLLKHEIAFISKPENFEIPILGTLIRPCGFLPLDRDNAKNAITTINAAAALLKEDMASVAIYPEGTRNKTDAPLLPFHNGAFKIAQKANVPIVVTVLFGTDLVKKNAPWRRTDTTLKILEVIPAERVKAMRTAEIGDYVERLLRSALTEAA